MHISFRQGIVQAPNAFLQANGATVNLSIASPAIVLAAVADGQADYLITERSTITSAWTGPFVSGTDYWLYWDINPISGVRTFGHTLLEPAEGNSAPLSPVNDQHWFDTNLNVMKVWNNIANRWVKKIRVFAGKYQSGSTFISMSINAPSYVGTQIGVLENIPVDVGSLVFDLNGDPVKRNNGTFFTTEDVVTASIASASQIKVGAVIIEAVATTNIPAYSIVTFTGFHQVGLATNMMLGEGAYGMIEVDAVIGDVVHVILQGVITNPAWDWTVQGVNTPLYVDAIGALSVMPQPNPVVVGTIVDINSILLRPSLQAVTTTTGTPLVTQDESVTLTADTASINFVGAGVTATAVGQAVTVTVPGGGSSIAVSDEGGSLTAAATSFNFVGAGVTATNVGPAVTVTVPGGGGAPSVQAFSATAAQTVFNTTIGTVAISGSTAHLQVFVNGVFQQEGLTKQYTVTGPNQITFNAGLQLADDVVIFAFA